MFYTYKYEYGPKLKYKHSISYILHWYFICKKYSLNLLQRFVCWWFALILFDIEVIELNITFIF